MADLSDAIDWPNGRGMTWCSPEYRTAMDERNAIHNPQYDGASLEDLSPEDYQAWNVLDARLLDMQASGEHLGASERF